MKGVKHSKELAYIIGVSLGDGNLSCPNGRATRLRITCDSNFPNIAKEIVTCLKLLFPKNKVSYVPATKDTYFNISVYSNKLNEIMPWQVGAGSKHDQQAQVPDWIKNNKKYSKHCLRGLLQTDGSVYIDRSYTMVNFTNIIKPLADDVLYMFQSLSYEPRLYKTMQPSKNYKYTVRLAKNSKKFIDEINLKKH